MSRETRENHPPMVYKSPLCRDGPHGQCGSHVCTCICHRHFSSETERQFVAVRRVVMRGTERIAEAVSSTLARRIANALNRYTPNRKGY